MKTAKKKHSIPEDEVQSFSDIFVLYNNKKLDFLKMMNYCVTSKGPYIDDAFKQ